MVIQDGQGVAATLACHEVALEVHLPQIVRVWVLEATKTVVAGLLLWRYLSWRRRIMVMVLEAGTHLVPRA